MGEVINLYKTVTYRFVSEALKSKTGDDLKYNLLVYPKKQRNKHKVELLSTKHKPSGYSIAAKTILELTYVLGSKELKNLQYLLSQDEIKTDDRIGDIFEKNSDKLVSYVIV